MDKCIFSPHCMEANCDKSCPILVEISYLLERNNINLDSDVFKTGGIPVDKTLEILEKCEKQIGTVLSNTKYSSQDYADMLTYCAICNHWRGSRLHCTVYNLKLAKYLDSLKNSWTNGVNDELEYQNIWLNSSQVLIISNFDYVNFSDFECQTLLNILDSRRTAKLTTILVCPKLTQLISSKNSLFFKHLLNILENGVRRVQS